MEYTKWLQSNSKLVAGIFVVVIIAGAVWAGMSSYNLKQEKHLQSEFSSLDFAVQKQKETFERGKNPPPPPQKNEDGTIPAPLPSAVATGDLAKDYGSSITNLESFLGKHPGSPAGAMAGLRLANLYTEYKKPEESLKALQTVTYSKGLLGSLVKMELGTQMANLGKCKEANQVWGALASTAADDFLKGEVKLKQGLCAESQGELAQAEQHYREAIDIGPESETGRAAQKYLRLLKFKGQPDVKTE